MIDLCNVDVCHIYYKYTDYDQRHHEKYIVHIRFSIKMAHFNLQLKIILLKFHTLFFAQIPLTLLQNSFSKRMLTKTTFLPNDYSIILSSVAVVILTSLIWRFGLLTEEIYSLLKFQLSLITVFFRISWLKRKILFSIW